MQFEPIEFDVPLQNLSPMTNFWPEYFFTIVQKINDTSNTTPIQILNVVIIFPEEFNIDYIKECLEKYLRAQLEIRNLIFGKGLFIYLQSQFKSSATYALHQNDRGGLVIDRSDKIPENDQMKIQIKTIY